MAVCDIKSVASPNRRVLSGLSWGSLESSVNIQDLGSNETAGDLTGIWSVLVKSFQSLLLLLLLASVVDIRSVEVSGSVDRPRVSNDPLFVSETICVVSSVSTFPAVEKCVSAPVVSRRFL